MAEKKRLEFTREERLDVSVTRINSCEKCPAFTISYMTPAASGKNRCDIKDRKVPHPKKIPKWCPFPRTMSFSPATLNFLRDFMVGE